MRSAPPSSETLTRTNLPGQRPVSSGVPAPLPPGATLGRYVVLHVVGEGGMGVVYAAHDFVLDRRVAVKLVRRDLRPDEREARKARLVAEAQAVGRLSHPNVIAVYDVGEFGGEIYIAMELVPGQTLADWLKSGPRSLEQVLDVFMQAGRGLAAAHRAGLIHRDFKPHNVLVGVDGRVRVTDFGLAVSAGTAGGDGAGTPAYMAPEQADGKGSARADQFSFGVALHEAVAGARPGQDGATVTVPRWLRRIIWRALRPVDERFPSMDEMLEALDRGERSRQRVHHWVRSVTLAGVAALATAVAVKPPSARAAERFERVVQKVVEIPALVRAGAAAAVTAVTGAAPAEPAAPTEVAKARAPEAPPAAAAAVPWRPASTANRWSTPSSRRAAPEATAARERHDPSWVAALEKLVRAMRDFGLLGEDSLELRAPPSALAAADRDTGDEGLTWVPGWAVRPDSRASFYLDPADGVARVGGGEGGASRGGDPVALAETRFELAQSLWDANTDRERALMLAEQARAALQQDDAAASNDLLGKIEEWLRQRQTK
ncbi:MAG TPA: serine/threonine-protein kinase [Myxococcaceae bacterium]|nr:serine/threonine-protein kinase [Myxococcaceae bacterium]